MMAPSCVYVVSSAAGLPPSLILIVDIVVIFVKLDEFSIRSIFVLVELTL